MVVLVPGSTVPKLHVHNFLGWLLDLTFLYSLVLVMRLKSTLMLLIIHGLLLSRDRPPVGILLSFTLIVVLSLLSASILLPLLLSHMIYMIW